MSTISAYTIHGFTRPELHLDSHGNIVLDDVAQAFAQQYGLKLLYLGCPPGTPWPPVLDTVSKPVDTNSADNSVAEGAAANTGVGVTVHSDSLLGPVTYSLSSDSSGGGFKIDPHTGVVTVADPSKIDFESASGHAYTVTAMASDGILSNSQAFTIKVTDVAPSTPVDNNAAANTVAEGAAKGTTVGITASSSDVNGPAVTYSLVGDTSNGGFAVNPTTGVVTVNDPTKIDYETAPGHAYTVTVQASDGTLTSAQSFTIAVTDVAPSTPADSNAAANTVTEGAAAGTTVGITASSADVNGPAVTYSLIGDTSGGGFTINSTTGVVTVADPTKIDYETSGPAHKYSITVQASDGTLNSTHTFDIAVADVAPSTPTDSNAAANSVAEGAAAGTSVGLTASSTDVNGPAVTYALIGDTSGGGFTINSTTGVVTVADPTKLDYESSGPNHQYTVTVQASDGTLTSSQNFDIAVTDVAPSTPTDSNAAANSVNEGAAAGTSVGLTASSTDVNGPAVTYALIGDTSGGGFTINSTTGVVTVADPTKLDYESSAPNHSYDITVQASDGTLTSAQTFTINVNDVTIGQPVDTNSAVNSVAEGAAVDTLVGITASATDPNGPATTYSLIGDTSGGGFKIDASTGVVSIADPTKIDYETSGAGHSYDITVQALNGATTTQQTFTIAVSDVAPSTPTDSDAAANTVAEAAAAGTTVGITASSTDVNGPAVTYSLIGDTSGGGFTINSTTGVVTVADPTKIDYESSGPGHNYTVAVQASDGTLTSAQNFTIAVSDASPSTPIDSNASANAVAEGAAAGTTVGITASSTDPNGPAVTYSLIGDTSNGGFTVDANTGVVIVADPTRIDYENSGPGHNYTVTVQASDGTLTSAQSFTIGVTDTAPSTPVDSNAAGNTVAEGAANGTTVGITASSTDVNGPAVTYSLIGDTSGGGFTINSSTGVVTVADSTKIDYESSSGHNYTVTVQASDGTLASTKAFDIAVSDVAPSAPVDSDGAANTVSQGAPAGSYTGLTASSTDVNGPLVTYSIVGDTSGGGFAVDSSTGKVTVADSSKIVYDAAHPSYDVTVDASDGTLHSQQTFTIGVILDSPPVVTAGHTLAYTENQVATAIDPALMVGDPDSATLAHATVQISGNYVSGEDVLGFTNQNGITGSFDAATGTLTLTGSSSVANYQTALASVTYFNTSDNPSAAPRTVTIIANDGTLDGTAVTDTINVAPVNDPPVVTAAHALNYTENQAATAIDSLITVTDVDNATLASATVQITGNYASGQDILAFTNQNGITGSFDAASGKLTLSGSSTVANYQAALASVTYYDNSDNPSGLDRTVTFIANDGTANSTGATTTIHVTPVNDPPVTTAGGTLNYLENQAATAIDPSVTVSDVDNANLAGATVAITGNYANGQDVLGFTNQNGITGSFDATTGTLTLTGSSSVANYQTALDSVTYHNTSDNPSGLDRTVGYSVNDGAATSTVSSSTIHVTPVNDAPVVTIGSTSGFTEPPNGTPAASSTPVTIAPSLTVSDVDSANLTGATFVLNNLKPSDALSVANHAGASGDIGSIHFDITSTATTETVTFTGTDTIAHYNAALELVQFNNTSENPDTTARSYTVTAVDDGGTANGGNNTGSANGAETVTVVDDAPTASAPADLSVGTAFSHTNLAISGLSVDDVDAGSGNVTATISAGHAGLTFATTGLSSFTNNGSHTVTLTGTVAQVNTALSSLVYNSDDGFTGPDTVTVSVNDNGNTGTGGPLSSGNHIFHVGVVPQVFYIDNTNAGAGNGTGTAADPFHSIAAFNAANPAATGDYVVLKHGTGTYAETNGINLADGVNLIGGNETLTFTNPVTGVVVTANNASGTAPIIKVTGLDNGIDLLGSSGHIIKGISIDTTASGGMGISDDNNNVGTVSLSDLVVKTASGIGLNFTHGGTVTVTGTANSITSGTGIALDISNTTIGSNGLIFHDISANGAASGIVLNNTGTSGHLVVTGDGSTAGSGGTIQNTTGDAVSLTGTQDVSLSYMKINNSLGNGIFGSNVTGIVLVGDSLSGNASANNQAGINLTNLTGNAFHVTQFTNISVANSYDHNVQIYDTSGNLTNLVVTGSTFSNNGASQHAGSDFNFLGDGTATVTLTATNNTFSGNATGPSSTAQTLTADGLHVDAASTSTVNAHIGDGTAAGKNTFTNNNVGIDLSVSNTAKLNFDVNDNVVTGSRASAINFFANGTGVETTNGFIHNNTVGIFGVTNSGSQTGYGIRFDDEGGGTSNVLIDSNTVQELGTGAGTGSEGIVVFKQVAHAGTLNATVTNNAIRDILDDAGMEIVNHNSVAGSVINADVHGNTFTNVNSTFEGFIMRVGDGTNNTHTHVAQANAAAVAAANGLTSGQVEVDPSVVFNSAPPTQPTATPMLAALGGVHAASPTTGEMNLTETELNSVVAAAIADWAAAGATAAELAAMKATTFSVGDLSGDIIGQEIAPAHITIDLNAAGHGWYVDPTPSNNFEFTHAQNAAGTDLLTDPTSAAAGHMDLLTTVMHELGHVVSLPDSTQASDANDLMYISLVEGERRLPGAADVAQANAPSNQTESQAPAGVTYSAPTAQVTSGVTGGLPTLASQPDAMDHFGQPNAGLPSLAAVANFVFSHLDTLGSSSPGAQLPALVKNGGFDFSALMPQTTSADVTPLHWTDSLTPAPAPHALQADTMLPHPDALSSTVSPSDGDLLPHLAQPHAGWII